MHSTSLALGLPIAFSCMQYTHVYWKAKREPEERGHHSAFFEATISVKVNRSDISNLNHSNRSLWITCTCSQLFTIACWKARGPDMRNHVHDIIIVHTCTDWEPWGGGYWYMYMLLQPTSCTIRSPLLYPHDDHSLQVASSPGPFRSFQCWKPGNGPGDKNQTTPFRISIVSRLQ